MLIDSSSTRSAQTAEDVWNWVAGISGSSANFDVWIQHNDWFLTDSQARSILSIPMQWTSRHMKKILWHEAMRVLLNNTSFYLPQCQWNAAPCYIRAIVIKWTKWSLNCFKRAWTTAWKRFLQWFCIVRAGCYLTVGEQGWGWENQITRHFMWWSVILGFWSLCL